MHICVTPTPSIGNQNTEFQLNLPKQTLVTTAYVRSASKHFSFRTLCLTSSTKNWNWSVWCHLIKATVTLLLQI